MEEEDTRREDALLRQDTDQSAFLGAVHRLIRNANGATKLDLLLTTVIHALSGRSMTVEEIAERASRIWPGVSDIFENLDDALAVGRELGLLAVNEGLSAEQLWVLTEAGAEDIRRHREWSSEVRGKASEELASRAQEGLTRDLSSTQAGLWLESLISALIAGIRQSQDAYLGHIEAIVGGQVRPRKIDRQAVLTTIRRSVGNTDPERTEFLEAMALAAMDPLDSFGNDLVSHITTGCIIHSYVAGRDRQGALSRVGSARGERAFLDTPSLLRLIGASRLRDPMEVAIRAAVRSGWEVHALQHSVEELQDVVRKAIPHIVENFRRAHEAGAREAWYASLVDEQIPSIYIEAAKEGALRSTDDFQKAADELPQRLEALGVTVRPAGNGAEAHRVSQFGEALKEQLSEGRRRSQLTVERDAQTMAAAYRRRRRQVGTRWPGAWVITNDRHLGPAYAAVTGDAVSITLTPSQWSSLLAASADPPGVLELAEAAAGQWVEEAMWTIPARFPSETALELASQLAPEQGGSSMSLRMAQLTLDEALTPATTAASLAAPVLARRNTMLQAVMRRRASSAEKEAAEALTARTEALFEAGDARAAQARMEAQLGAMQNEMAMLRSDHAADSDALAWRQQQVRRVVIVMAVCALSALVLVVGLLVSQRLVMVTGAAALLLGGYSGYRWCTNRESKFMLLLVATLIGSVGFVSAAIDLWDRFVT